MQKFNTIKVCFCQNILMRVKILSTVQSPEVRAKISKQHYQHLRIRSYFLHLIINYIFCSAAEQYLFFNLFPGKFRPLRFSTQKQES